MSRLRNFARQPENNITDYFQIIKIAPPKQSVYYMKKKNAKIPAAVTDLDWLSGSLRSRQHRSVTKREIFHFEPIQAKILHKVHDIASIK